MERFFLHCLWLLSLLSHNLANCTITDDEEPRRTYPSRRAIDGTRGSKYYVADEDDPFDIYGSSRGQYNPYEEETDLSDIRNNVPGEPGVDYPSYTRLPQTGFVCEGHFTGYYADEAAGCQVFHVCDGNFLVSSFLCPIGSIFSQKLLTCDWWSKVDCSLTREYHAINSQSVVSEANDDDISRKTFKIESVQSASEKIPVESPSQQQPFKEDRRQKILNFAVSGSAATERANDLPIGQENYFDYSDYPSRLSSRYKSTSGQQKRQRNQQSDYYSENAEPEVQRKNENPSRKISTIGNDRKNNHRDSLNNEFQSSYAPTAPTVTTTARKYYSPTISTTHRPSTASDTSDNYDLDFESSDHLYTARGRSEETVEAATPPSFTKKDEPKVGHSDLSSLVNGADEGTKKIDNMEESESFDDKINLSIDKIHRNATTVETLNETIISLNDKEKAIDRDLNRLMEKITETISILTIDNENRNPAGFSYKRDEETSTSEDIVKKSEDIAKKNENTAKKNEKNAKKNENIVKNFAEPPTSINSTSLDHEGDSKGDKRPAEFLEPPKESVGEFRITVLNEALHKNNEKFTNSEKLVKKNSTEKIIDKVQEKLERIQGKILTVEALATHITPPLLSDEKERRESRIIRFFVNNSTNTNSTGGSKVRETSIGKIESIDLTPPAIFSKGNFSESKIIPKKVVEKLEAVKPINEKSLNLTTLTEIVSMTTSVSSQNLTSKNSTQKLENPIDIIHEKVISKESNVTMLDDKSKNNSTSFLKEKETFERFNQSEKIVSNDSNIDDSVQLGSSPFQVTLTVNKNEEIDPNGEVIRKLIAQQEIGDSIGAADYKSFEIVKSAEPQESHENPEIHFTEDSTILRSDRKINDESEIYDENLQKFNSNRLQSTNYLRSIAALVNGPNLPRPFSFDSPRNVEIKTPSDLSEELISSSSQFSQTNKNVNIPETTEVSIQTTQFVGSTEQPKSEKSLETLQVSSSGFPREIKNSEGFLGQLSQTFGENERKTNKEKLIFDLPDSARMLDFSSGLPLRLPEDTNTRFNDEQHNVEKLKKVEEEMKKLHEKTVVQTEFVPSIGFSLNTDEERNEYMEAVQKGLLPGVRATEKTINETKSSNES